MFKFLFQLFKKTPVLPSKLPSILSPVSVLSFSMFRYPYLLSSRSKPGVGISGWLQSALLSCFFPLNHPRPMWDHSLSVPKSMWVPWLPWWTITPLSPKTRRTDGKYQKRERERERRSSCCRFCLKLPSIITLDLRCGWVLMSIASVVFSAIFLQMHISFASFLQLIHFVWTLAPNSFSSPLVDSPLHLSGLHLHASLAYNHLWL